MRGPDAQRILDYVNLKRQIEGKPTLAPSDLLEPCSCLVEKFRSCGVDRDGYGRCGKHKIFGEVTGGMIWASIDP